MRLKELIIEAEENLAYKLAQYDLSEDEYHEFEAEYNQYLVETYTVPTDDEINRMCTSAKFKTE